MTPIPGMFAHYLASYDIPYGTSEHYASYYAAAWIFDLYRACGGGIWIFRPLTTEEDETLFVTGTQRAHRDPEFLTALIAALDGNVGRQFLEQQFPLSSADFEQDREWNCQDDVRY